LAIVHRHRVGAAWASVEKRHLAEYFARIDDVEHGLAAVGCRNADLHGAPQDRHQPGPGIALCEDGGGAAHRAARDIGAEMLDDRGRELAEQWMVPQRGELVENPRRLFGVT